ncbi:MAG: beta-ketoacyl synthase N-terminal-like domain-containing protein [Myxococcota bacterium]
MSTLGRRTFVVGGRTTPFIGKKHPDFVWKGHPDFGRRDNPTLDDYVSLAVNGTLEETGTPAEAVDRAWIGNFVGELFSKQGHLGAAVVGANPGLAYKPVTRVEAACASGGLAFSGAVESIQAGADVALVVGVEVQTTESARTGGDYLARASHYARQRSIDDFTFPALFALRTRAYKERYGVTDEDIGRVSVKAYTNANRNPLAHMRAVTMDLDTASHASEKNPNFLSNAELSPYIRMSDCSQVSDGGSGMVVVSERGLAKLGKTPADAIELVSIAHTTGNLWKDGDATRLDTTAVAAQRALQAAGVRASDVQVCEVHDCFTVTELLMMEAIGFCAPGQAAALVREGRTAIDGDLPINTGGGLVGFGHPVGATGVKQVVEIWRQMKGKCGDYQVARTPALGLTANMGGDDKTVVVSVFRNA